MKDNRVTIGCSPPEDTKYCPERDLTRAEMAAFLHRLDTRDVFVTPAEADAADDPRLSPTGDRRRSSTTKPIRSPDGLRSWGEVLGVSRLRPRR